MPVEYRNLHRKPRSVAFHESDRPGVYEPTLCMLEDGSGFLLLEDGSRLMLESGDTGYPMIARLRGVLHMEYEE